MKPNLFRTSISLAVFLGMLTMPTAGRRLAVELAVETKVDAQTDAKFEQLATLVTQKMTEYSVPGVAFGVVKNGQLTARGFGVTNIDQPQPIDADTVFPIASISKTVTATAIMRLVEQGKVDLAAPVQKYLPGFRVQDEAMSRGVAIWQLLTHTPGWEGQLTAEDRGTQTLAYFSEWMRDLPPLAPPGTVWSYNNAGFTLAGRVIEVVTGRSIQDAIRELVFDPIGLTRAFTRLEEAATYRFSVAHRQQTGKTVVARPYSRSSSLTAGGVFMSLNDLLAYGKFHLGDGTGKDGQRVLTRASLDQMRTPKLRKVATDEDMGIGWHLRTVGGVMTAAHGGTLGHCLLIELVPARNLVLVILTNHSDGWRLIQDVERAALKVYEGLALDPKQTIGHRGVNETMPDAPIMAKQPDPAPYVGVYRRTPGGMNTVREEKGQLMLDNSTVAFYAVDRAVVTSGNQRGNPVEFIRRPDGTVGWVRSVGRIARKEGALAQSTRPSPQPAITQADVRFMQGMIGHHAQALEMTALLRTRTTREDMTQLARRMEVSQADEIKTMREWLNAHGQDVPSEHAHHAPGAVLMPGMLTVEEMARLSDAKGSQFDKLFLELMITHHEGALVMVKALMAQPGAAQDSNIFAFASDVEADQLIEIRRMRAMLEGR